MKKALSLILALVLCLGLCACNNDKASSNAQAEETTTENQSAELGVNEIVQNENFELCIIGNKFCVRGPLAIEPLDGEPNNGAEEVYGVVYLGVKNTGKTEVSIPSSIIGKINYKDGYEFSPNGCSELSSCNWMGAKSYITSDSTLSQKLTTLQPLSPAKLLAVLFIVPREVMENTSEPAILKIELDGQEYIYDLRTSSNILSKEDGVSDLAADVITQYQEAWLIRNISDCVDTLHEDVTFVWNYAGNVNGAGERKFADDFLNRLTTAFDYINENVSNEDFNKVLPETAAALQNIQTDCIELRRMLEEMGETNSEEYVKPIVDKAWELMGFISDVEKSAELRKYGNF